MPLTVNNEPMAYSADHLVVLSDKKDAQSYDILDYLLKISTVHFLVNNIL